MRIESSPPMVVRMARTCGSAKASLMSCARRCGLRYRLSISIRAVQAERLPEVTQARFIYVYVGEDAGQPRRRGQAHCFAAHLGFQSVLSIG